MLGFGVNSLPDRGRREPLTQTVDAVYYYLKYLKQQPNTSCSRTREALC
jgi:hypothetical protein